MSEPIPIACSLEADSYVSRMAAIRSVGAAALLRSESRSGGAGVDLYFRNSPDIDRRLHDVMEAEAKCCAFLDMKLSSEDDTLRLSISGPAGAHPVIEDLLRSFESGHETGLAS